MSLTASAQNIMPVLPTPVVAHRGFSFAAPENTLASTRLAVETGADGCECDIYATVDGKIVLLHDETLKRTAGLDKKVAQCDFETVRALDAGSWKSPDFAGEKVPTLEEFLDVLKTTNCRPVVEIKMPGIEQQTVEAIRNAGLTDRAAIISFSSAVVKKVRELEPRLCVGWLYGEKQKGTTQELADLLTKTAEQCDTTLLDLNHELISPELLKILKNRGLHVWAWTVDDPKRMETLLRWGVESITTNRPDLLIGLMR